MGLEIKIAMILVFAAVAALLVFSVLFFLRPLRVTVWSRRSALRRAGCRKRRISTSLGEQTVWHGGAGPVLVLLHGAGDQAGTWNKVAPELKRSYRLLIPDLAGHGESEPRAGALSIGTVLSTLEQVCDAVLEPNATVVIAGNSFGAWMAMLYAQKHPHRVTRAVLIDGGPVKGVTQMGLMPKDREEARRVMDAVLDPSSPRPPDFVLDDLVRMSNSGPISRLMAAGAEDMARYLLEGKLASFELPVDLIWGSSDRLVPLEYAKKLQSQLPRCTLTVVERCGHAPQLERPHEFTRVLLNILTPEPTRVSASKPAASVRPEENS